MAKMQKVKTTIHKNCVLQCVELVLCDKRHFYLQEKIKCCEKVVSKVARKKEKQEEKNDQICARGRL
jgi:hypothetical protein